MHKAWLKNILRKRVLAAVSVAAFLLFPCALYGSEPYAKANSHHGEALSIAGAVEAALKNNSKAKAAKAELSKVESFYPAAKAFDDPMLSYTYMPRDNGKEEMFSLTQSIPFPGNRLLKGRSARKDIDIASVRYDKAVREVVAEVKKAYYELYYIDKAMEVTRENDAVLEYFEKASRTNYGLDVSGLDELVRAKRLHASSSLNMVSLGALRQWAVSNLNVLMNRAAGEDISLLEEPLFPPSVFDEGRLRELALKHSPEIRERELAEDKSVIEKKLSTYVYLPHFVVGVSYSRMTEDAPVKMSDTNTGFMAGISIPLWLGKNRAVKKSAAYAAEVARFEKERAYLELEGGIKAQYHKVESGRRIVELYTKKLIPEAKESLEFAEVRYKNGKEKLGRLLEAQSLWLDFRLAYFRAFADYLKDLAELERLVGADIGKADENRGKR